MTVAIKELRRRVFPSQQSLAVKIGTSVRTVAHWEAGRVPGLKFLIDLEDLARQLRYKDLEKIFTDRIAQQWSKQPNKVFYINPRNNLELTGCMLLLNAMRNPQLNRYANRAMNVLKPIREMLSERDKQVLAESGALPFSYEEGNQHPKKKTPSKKRRK